MLESQKSTLITAVIVSVIVGGGAFYAGEKNGEQRATIVMQRLVDRSFGPNMPSTEVASTTTPRTAQPGGPQNGVQVGYITALNRDSITIQTRKNGPQESEEKTIDLSNLTTFSKSSSISFEELAIGQRVTIILEQLKGGVIAAKSVSVGNPAMENKSPVEK